MLKNSGVRHGIASLCFLRLFFLLAQRFSAGSAVPRSILQPASAGFPKVSAAAWRTVRARLHRLLKKSKFMPHFGANGECANEQSITYGLLFGRFASKMLFSATCSVVPQRQGNRGASAPEVCLAKRQTVYRICENGIADCTPGRTFGVSDLLALKGQKRVAGGSAPGTGR